MSKVQVQKISEDGAGFSNEREARLKVAEAVFETAGEGIMICDADNRIVNVNPAFTSITGFSRDQAVGQTPALLNSGKHDKDFFRGMWESIERNGKWSGEIWNRRQNGEIYPQWLSITVIEGGGGNIEQYVAVFTDISLHKMNDEKGPAEYQSNYDALTNLPNRRLLHDRIHQALAQAAQNKERVGILYLDLDNFKNVNDSLGYSRGDAVLVEMGNRVKGCLRDRDAIGRMGGDKFLVILPQLRTAEETTMILWRLLEAVGNPLTLKGHKEPIMVTTSIGIAIYPDDGETAADLIRNADTAAFHVKKQGGGNWQFFTEDMNIRAMERLTQEKKLRQALEKDQLVLHYQPKVELRRGRIIGMEALVRWQDPDDGELMPPASFIPLAEETGLIIPLGEWVLHTACAQAKAWQEAGMRPMGLAVNLSARQLMKKDLLADMVRILDATGLTPEFLEMEITETSLMERADEAIVTLRGIQEMGVKLAADDFGTGYSSLNYLRNFPLNSIKIDHSFVADIGGGGGGAMLAAAVIAIGQSLGLRVIAEGVESQEQLAFLRQQWCDEIQGFLFSRPLPVEAFEALMREDRRL